MTGGEGRQLGIGGSAARWRYCVLYGRWRVRCTVYCVAGRWGSVLFTLGLVEGEVYCHCGGGDLGGGRRILGTGGQGGPVEDRQESLDLHIKPVIALIANRLLLSQQTGYCSNSKPVIALISNWLLLSHQTGY